MIVIEGKKYYTVDEVQEMFDWSDLHTKRMRENLKFPWTMVSRKRLVAEEDLKNIDGYMERRSAEFSNQPKRKS